MITVIGLGFVGLTTGLGFAHKGLKVFGYDISAEKLRLISAGNIPFHEPGLTEALAANNGRNFVPTDDLAAAVAASEVIFLCVGTPSGDDGSADLSQLYDSIGAVLKHVDKKKFRVIVVKSTIPPSTTSEKIKPFIEKAGFTVGTDIGLANNPEFLREGFAWDDFIHPDRIVAGVEDEKSAEKLRDIYKPFEKPLYVVSYNTGEYIKYLSNTLLSTLISFANEQSMIALSVGGINIAEAFRVLHMDKRWSGNPAKMTSYAYPGCGFGGYCLPKDTSALVALAGQKGHKASLLADVLKVNNSIRDFHVDRISASVKKEETIGILGLSFKPESDDVRDTPAADIIRKLLDKGYRNIVGYDPIATGAFAKLYDLPIRYAKSAESIASECSCVVVVTAWQEFKTKKHLWENHKIFDLRYILS